MRTFFLDLTGHPGVVAIVGPTQTLAIVEIPDHKDEAGLLQRFDAALTSAGCTRDDLTHLACVTGPGGFTTLRVAVAAVNALGAFLRLPIAGVHASDLWHARIGERDAVWLHSTRKTQLFIRGFGRYAVSWPEPTLIDLSELMRVLPEATPMAGDLLPDHRSALHVVDATPLTSLADVLPELAGRLPYTLGTPIEPMYGRGM